MRIAMGIEYDGTDFLGWQRLSQGPTVQATVEHAVSKVADIPIRVICSGRTDSGVHARCQVVHFDTQVERSMYSWVRGTTTQLPRSVAVLWAHPVADDFHARYSARARAYRYSILNRPVRAALDARYVTWERQPLDDQAMHQAAQALTGHHDFSAFRALACQASHARRDVRRIDVCREGQLVHVQIEANAFLYHMVRNILGSLLLIGRGEREPVWMAELLAGRDRDAAGPTAPASGLTFIGARYPAPWGLPDEVCL